MRLSCACGRDQVRAHAPQRKSYSSQKDALAHSFGSTDLSRAIASAMVTLCTSLKQVLAPVAMHCQQPVSILSQHACMLGLPCLHVHLSGPATNDDVRGPKAQKAKRSVGDPHLEGVC